MEVMSKKQPFENLGGQLKRIREQLKQTQAEVSGAVEIDVESLENFERGAHCPTEDILLLLISHFGINDPEANTLWKLAGYEPPQVSGKDQEQSATSTVLPQDARIVYTDKLHIMANNYGVVINFLQSNGPNLQPLIVSRVGMSQEHARSLIETLQRALYQAQPKALPAPKKAKRQKTDKS